LSPLSDTTNLAPIAAGSELYEHIKHMMWTTVPVAIVAMTVYLIVGLNISSEEVSAPETMNEMLETLSTMFNWNILLLLPPAIVLFGAIKKYPTLPVIILSSILAALLGIFAQGFTLKDVFASAVTGFDISMVNKEGFEASAVIPEVLDLVHQGGMQSMTSVILIAFSAFAFAGI